MDEMLAGKRILIVDDEPDILETLKELLNMCIIDTAPDFETAQKFLKKDSYDAAILDIMGVNGYDLLKLATEKGIPALMLTAHALSPDHLVKSLKWGARSYIPKEKMTDIDYYLVDLLQTVEKNDRKSRRWLDKIKPYFDKKFGSDWKDEHAEFWKEYDRTHPVTKEEVSRML
jgi:DNA-binding NtrC family response regulator